MKIISEMSGEFQLIEYIRGEFSSMVARGCEGIGDDCAVIPLSGDESYVVTTDMLVEDVHFVVGKIPMFKLGRKSLAVSLSDVAAMGATPFVSFLSISIPGSVGGSVAGVVGESGSGAVVEGAVGVVGVVGESGGSAAVEGAVGESVGGGWIKELIGGYKSMSEEFGVALLGGDTTRSPDRMVISVTVIGRVPNENIKRRKDARAGDIILVGGELGGSAKGLKDILCGCGEAGCGGGGDDKTKGVDGSGESCDCEEEGYKAGCDCGREEGCKVGCDCGREESFYDGTKSREAHINPSPQVKEGIWLGRQKCVHAMMDLSDGLASDLGHILKESKKGAKVFVETIPRNSSVELAVTGGEDYKLLLTADRDAAEELIANFEHEFGTPLYPIGEITDGEQTISWFENGIEIFPNWRGFTHF